MRDRVTMNRVVFSVGLSLATMLCQSGLALAQQAARGEAIITLDGNSYALAVFECRHGYPSPIDPARTIALALSAAPVGTPEELLEQLRENGDGGDNLEAVNAALARGALLSVGHYADGEDVLTFFPTPNLDDAVIVLSGGGFLDVTDHSVAGTVAASTMGGTPLGDLTLSAACP